MRGPQPVEAAATYLRHRIAAECEIAEDTGQPDGIGRVEQLRAGSEGAWCRSGGGRTPKSSGGAGFQHRRCEADDGLHGSKVR